MENLCLDLNSLEASENICDPHFEINLESPDYLDDFFDTIHLVAPVVDTTQREVNCIKAAIRVISGVYYAKALGSEENNPAGIMVLNTLLKTIKSWSLVSKTSGISYMVEVADAIKLHCSVSVLDSFRTSMRYLLKSVGKSVACCVKVVNTTSGLNCSILFNTKLLLKGFGVIQLQNDINVLLSRLTLNPDTVDALKRVNIHGVTFGSEGQVEYSSSLRWGTEFLTKLVLIVNSGISLDTLYRNSSYSLVLSINEFGELVPLAFPALSLSHLYLKTGAVSPDQARCGYVSSVKNIQGLIEYKDGCVLVANSVNKSVARLEKLVATEHTGWIIK